MKPRKPTKPTQPKGMSRSGGTGRKGRPVGYSVEYTPEQTARYKSQAVRYSKAVELANAGPDYIEFNGQLLSSDDAANLREAGGKEFKLTDRVLFRYASMRSGMDYWTVRFGGGGLEQVETFGDVITTTGTDDCPPPVVTWSWENPQFDWAAVGIKFCEGDEGAPGGFDPGGNGGDPLAPLPAPPPWFPVPAGQSRTVTVFLDGFSGGSNHSDACADENFSQPLSTAFDVILSDQDSIQFASSNTTSENAIGANHCFPGSQITGSLSTTGTLLLLPGRPNIFRSRFAVFSAAFGVRNTEFVSLTARFVFNLVPNPPPDSPTPGVPGTAYVPDPNDPKSFSLPSGVMPPMPPSQATAGGTFTSNTFTATSAVEVKSTLNYTTVPDIGAIAGSIAVQLYTSDDILVDAYGETPGNGGSGMLEDSFSLVAEQGYYFKIVIPELCYCDLARVTIGAAGFVCDCPDYTKMQPFAFNSRYNSEQTPRDWTASDAGCDQEQGCKHIIGTKLFLNLPVPVPTDIPL